MCDKKTYGEPVSHLIAEIWFNAREGATTSPSEQFLLLAALLMRPISARRVASERLTTFEYTYKWHASPLLRFHVSWDGPGFFHENHNNGFKMTLKKRAERKQEMWARSAPSKTKTKQSQFADSRCWLEPRGLDNVAHTTAASGHASPLGNLR